MVNLKNYWWILLLGLILRIIIASITFHPDVKILNFVSAVILREQHLNPYNFIASLEPNDPRKGIFSLETPDDLPLQYWINIPLSFLSRSIVDETIEDQFFTDVNPLFGNPALFSHLLAIKFPLIVFDLVLGFLLTLLVPLPKKRKILLFWMINPMTLWATVAIGQVDVIPTLFLVLSFIFLEKDKLKWSALALGMGAALKSFPLLLAPFLIFTAKNWTERLKLAFIIAVPWFISIVPYLNSAEFRTQALFAPQMDKVFYSKILLSGGEAISINILILGILYLLYFLKKRGPADFLIFSTSTLLLLLAFTHFHLQWFLWSAPFLLVLIVRGLREYQKVSLAAITFSVGVMLFLFESSLQIRLFSPLFPSLSESPGMAEIFPKTQVEFIRNMAASIFAAAAIFFSGTLLFKDDLRPLPHDNN